MNLCFSFHCPGTLHWNKSAERVYASDYDEFGPGISRESLRQLLSSTRQPFNAFGNPACPEALGMKGTTLPEPRKWGALLQIAAYHRRPDTQICSLVSSLQRIPAGMKMIPLGIDTRTTRAYHRTAEPKRGQKVKQVPLFLVAGIFIRFRDQESNIPVAKAGLVPGAKLCSYCRSGGNRPGPCRSMLHLEKRIGMTTLRHSK